MATYGAAEAVRVGPKHHLESHLGGKVYGHPHAAPYGLSLRLPFFSRFEAVFHTDRRRINMCAILLNIVVPWFAFCAVLALFSFSCYFYNPVACWIGALSILIFTAGGACCCAWLSRVKTEMYEEEEEHNDGPMWYAFNFIMMFLAVALGIVIGNCNFSNHMIKVYQYHDLATYSNIQPKDWQGAQLPDAGIITFTQDTYLKTEYSMGFKDTDVYCVAPIVSPLIKHYDNFDFWAVGKNCCTGVDSDFTCEGYNDAEIHGGLRLLDEEARPFYRLAVQQAESTNFINTRRPLFFLWTKDPAGDIADLRKTGLTIYLASVLAAWCIQCFLVIAAMLFYAKVYPMDGSP